MKPIRTDWRGQPFPRTGKAKRIRDLLRARREALRVTRVELGEAIASFLNAREEALDGAYGAHKALHQNTVYMWETFQRHPSIDTLSAWARVLGYRLHVELALDPDKSPVMVKTERAADIARVVDEWPADLQEIVWEQVQSIDDANRAT